MRGEQAASFLLLICNVKSDNQRADPRIGAPDGDQETKEESPAQFCGMRASEPCHLVPDEAQDITGQNASQIGEVLARGRNVGEQSIQRDECAYRGEKSQQD